MGLPGHLTVLKLKGAALRSRAAFCCASVANAGVSSEEFCVPRKETHVLNKPSDPPRQHPAIDSPSSLAMGDAAEGVALHLESASRTTKQKRELIVKQLLATRWG